MSDEPQLNSRRELGGRRMTIKTKIIQQEKQWQGDRASYIRWLERVDRAITRGLGGEVNAYPSYDYKELFYRGWKPEAVAAYVAHKEEG